MPLPPELPGFLHGAPHLKAIQIQPAPNSLPLLLRSSEAFPSILLSIPQIWTPSSPTSKAPS